ncbi:hypothetical protein KUTeg_014647 [Tegillarca granosa]|uniref:THAP-type domain-containing protein n=1 Tax=Tegillarca granosa TaxID=220873 RepID=A0ABQ9EV22_TEGGR|nr:hypothetical protein KUTeg_014647 [Tegillarca granosa]
MTAGKMVKSCSVYGCSNRANNAAKEKGIKFFKFPKTGHKRRAWIKALNRKNWTPNKNSYVCSSHFVDGWHAYDREEQDYAPTVFSYKQRPVDKEREERASKRDLSKIFQEAEKNKKTESESMLHLLRRMHNYSSTDTSEDTENQVLLTYDDIDLDIKITENKGVQCDADHLIEENLRLQRENNELRSQISELKWSVNKIKDNDKATRLYTGLPSFAVFVWLFKYVYCIYYM